MSLKSDFLSVFPISPEEMKMNLFTLSFEGELEDTYKRHEMKRELGQRRIGLIIAVVIYALFGFMDMFLMPETKNIAWFVRFGLCIPLTLGVFIASYWDKLQSWMEFLISIVIVASGIGHLAILAYAPKEISTHYYMGLVIFMLFSLTILRTDFVKSLISGFFILLGYVFYALQIEKAPFTELYASVFILFSCWVICAAACYLLEYKSRSNYYLNQIIHTGQLPRLPKEEVVREKTVVKTVESPVNKLYENLTDWIWFMTPQGEFKYLSPSVKDFLGYEPEDLEGKRGHQVHASDSYQRLEAGLLELGSKVNRLVLTLEYKTRAGLIKEGHTVVVRYQDKRLGEGFLGTTRALEGSIAQNTLLSDSAIQPQMVDVEAYEAEKARLHQALEKAQAELQALRNIEENELAPVVPERHLPEEQVLAIVFDGYRKDVQHTLQKAMDKLILKNKGLEEKFTQQTMKKHDLESYLHDMDLGLNAMEKRNTLHDVVQAAYVAYQEKRQKDPVLKPAQADQLLEKAILSLKAIFKGTQYVIDFDCPEGIEMQIETDLFKEVIQSLIAMSLLYGFKNTNKGILEIKAEKRDNTLIIHCIDNGEDYQVTGIDHAVNQLLGWDQRHPYAFNLAKTIVESRFKGTLGFDLSDTRNAVRLALPLSH